ncbi:3-isopropylmalate dehydratase large subunit [Desulfurella amilsii]|uniref:3-isopropylmalate dehydratase large subunit n=1 Tax=Desulfurella amilsii TaxID=1562698 RepID=A0A1X4Y015_9BACT|nr:3-isopropylmalate dehydratase large subunit [Desulfurella amilsii]OSS43137.1 3-isopropylmalate dehydratase large subunit [Desulfurella amilsii]
MGKMTISQKILAKHASKEFVKPGEIILADVDLAFANDVTAPIVIKFVNDLGGVIANKDKIALIPDHFTPNKDINSANQCKTMRDFVKQNDIKHYFESGEVGIEHALLPEQGFIKPGMLIVGADSHTCTHGAFGAFATGMGSSDVGFAFVTGKSWFRVPESIKFIINGKKNKWVSGKDFILKIIGTIGVDGALYKSMEFCGSAIGDLSMDDRMTMCNMAVEAGGKNGIIQADKTTINYLQERNITNYEIFQSDEDAEYASVYEFDSANIEPQVAFPHLPENAKGISEVKEDIKIDQAFIGSCTNGRISDLRIAAQILKNNKVAKYVRLIIIPATVEIYKQALKEGLFDIFLDSGAVISTPTCGPCLGGHMGILADGEVAISTSNRNFVGRMGSPKSFVYLANPAVVAASAIAGKIINPDEVIK